MRRRSHSARAAQGVTLLEMLLVIALIALVGTLSAVVLTGGLSGMQLRSQAKQLAAQLRYTRTQAMARGESQQFVIQPDAHRWQAAADHHGEIPQALAIRFTGARQAQPAKGQGAIVFFSDGGSTGGRIELQDKRAVWRIDVAWLTGEVSVSRVVGNDAAQVAR
ncbi:type II secretion system protein XpsH [Pseudoxanthomonas dokdonensis]|uniref:Type II secretion system protein H n=1 Tax=Pseudoxanthomonas dokdonensis TaxID=344882 RepID=A0A0R0CJ93_9GAMM|nr:GspH/FimT family pseudopilin [Pseudoxanthomonas dokdonensis]KRG69653.1 general secretion pathway protein GspH [Pseudoxanthomonas dokdonensis]